MKVKLLGMAMLIAGMSWAQHKVGEDVTVTVKQHDDTYLSGETVETKAPIAGDMVVAAGTITVRDSIYQDLLVAGGEITVTGHVADDIRAAGGTLIIDTEIGDDVMVAGGEVLITENAIINGNLINFSGEIELNGKVKGMIKSFSGDMTLNGSVENEIQLFGGEILVNGTIDGTSKIVAESIEIGERARFNNDVSYWSEEGEVDFKNSLVGTKASYDETLKPDSDGFSWRGFGILAFGFWLFYLFSAFLVLLLMNWAFNHFFSEAANRLDTQFLKSLGYGLLYLFGLPFAIAILFVIIIGIPLGLFLGGFYVFSLIFAHLAAALLLSHYLGNKGGRKWNFWTIIFLALGIAAVIRLLTFIPFMGALIAVVVMALGYGLLIIKILERRKSLKLA